MRPGERDADDGHGQDGGVDEVEDRQPPAGKDQPDEIAENAQRAGADILAAGEEGVACVGDIEVPLWLPGDRRGYRGSGGAVVTDFGDAP